MSEAIYKAAEILEGDILLKIEGLEKTFEQGGNKLTIFKNLDLKIEAGELVALVGQSGSGKSTLLQLAGLLDRPTGGQIKIAGRSARKMSEKERAKTRLSTIGFIYQFHHLLPEFTALENVAMPQIIAGVKIAHAKEKAASLLESLGLGARLTHRPARLSGGEQQRVAIARALVNDPKLLLADEPTGNLDPGTSAEVFEILLAQVRQRRIGALIATHNLQLADQMDRAVELKAGRIAPFD
ncbi:MAG: ABC transporter ATP-binding protein [Alphaproteobacteria bacterium]|nr:ABC transporter ATP-binding protein [Alphaproteobacteria bacterium]